MKTKKFIILFSLVAAIAFVSFTIRINGVSACVFYLSNGFTASDCNPSSGTTNYGFIGGSLDAECTVGYGIRYLWSFRGAPPTCTADASQSVSQIPVSGQCKKVSQWLCDTSTGTYNSGVGCVKDNSCVNGAGTVLSCPSDYSICASSCPGTSSQCNGISQNSWPNGGYCSGTCGWIAWSISLSPSTNPQLVGSSVTLTATTNLNVGSASPSEEILIKDTTAGTTIATCTTGTSCTASSTQSSITTHNFQATVVRISDLSVQASSNTVSVRWVQCLSNANCPVQNSRIGVCTNNQCVYGPCQSHGDCTSGSCCTAVNNPGPGQISGQCIPNPTQTSPVVNPYLCDPPNRLVKAMQPESWLNVLIDFFKQLA